jgi:hypothetical protein
VPSLESMMMKIELLLVHWMLSRNVCRHNPQPRSSSGGCHSERQRAVKIRVCNSLWMEFQVSTYKIKKYLVVCRHDGQQEMVLML